MYIDNDGFLNDLNLLPGISDESFESLIDKTIKEIENRDNDTIHIIDSISD